MLTRTDQAEADVEDLIGLDLYTEVINRSYDLLNDKALTPQTVKASAGTSERILEGVEALFRVMPADAPEFDHFRPSSWLASNENLLVADRQDIRDALDRFEKLFVVLNALLPSFKR